LRRPVALPLVLALVAAVPAAFAAERDAVDLLNPLLSPELAGWLLGAPGRMASDAEVREFVGLADDAAALAFVERFWSARDPDAARPGNPARETAERRAAEADRRFAESARAGRATDRGTIYVLHGEPEKIEFEPSELYGEPPLEIWRYPADAPEGLDGERPQRVYRFARKGDVTTFYVPGRPGRYTQRPPVGRPR
jgi:GWxTD domain-containing protein